jgi:hypothetical protein
MDRGWMQNQMLRWEEEPSIDVSPSNGPMQVSAFVVAADGVTGIYVEWMQIRPMNEGQVEKGSR